MNIHTKVDCESIGEIAKKYGTDEEVIRQANEIYDGEAAEGEELLIVTPTRSYKVQVGDSLEKIALRFNVRKKDLLCLNPWINGRELRAGDTLTVKCNERQGGMAVANGYYYPGCNEEKLKRAMPYLTYTTFCSAVADRRGITRTMKDSAEVNLVREEKKMPLVRVYDKYPERYKSAADLTQFAEELIGLATAGEYKGIVLNACSLVNSADEFVAFLMILRKMMIGSDLILINEINDKTPMSFSEYADGSIMYYPKYAVNDPPAFDEGERRVLSDFSCEGESAKTFVDLPAPARLMDRYIPYGEAMKIARECGNKISLNESTLLSHFCDKKQGECVFSSLSYIKAMLDLVRELDYMGVCFDIMRTPLSHMMMYNSIFKSSYFNSVRTQEGCSRASAE